MSGEPTHLESEVLRVEKIEKEYALFVASVWLVGWFFTGVICTELVFACLSGGGSKETVWAWEEMRRNRERALRHPNMLVACEEEKRNMRSEQKCEATAFNKPLSYASSCDN